MLGQGDVAPDLIICRVAADDEDAAAFEQFIGHFLPVLDLGRGVAFEEGGHAQRRADGRTARVIHLAAVIGGIVGVFEIIRTPGAEM